MPLYSLNLIESAYSKFKKLLRAGVARTVDKLWDLCGHVLDQFSECECRNFKHRGYRYIYDVAELIDLAGDFRC